MNTNDLLVILTQIGILYGSTTVASLIANHICYNNNIKRAYKKSERTLKFKELTAMNEVEVKKIKEFCKIECMLSYFISTIPLLQLMWTVNNLTRDPIVYENFLKEKMAEVNSKELEARKRFLEELKNRKVPEDIKIKMQDEDYLPTEDDYLRSKKQKRKKKIPVLRNHPIEDEHSRFWD
jgi:hypothetical protein